MTAARRSMMAGDRRKAHLAAVELVHHVDDRRRHPAGVTNLLLPAAMEILDQCGGDPIRALFVLADVVNTELQTNQTPSPAALSTVPTNEGNTQ